MGFRLLFYFGPESELKCLLFFSDMNIFANQFYLVFGFNKKKYD